jgi:aminopeptidase N
MVSLGLVLLSILGLNTAQADDRVFADRPGSTMPTRQWDMTHLDLDLEVHIEEGRVEGTATHTVRRLGGPERWLRLHQAALAFHEIKVNGEATENFRVHDEHIDIAMPSTGEEHEVTLRWTAHPETGLHFRGQPGSADAILEVWSQGEAEDNHYWFPGWDYPNDKFTLTTHLTAPASLHAVAPGLLTEKKDAQKGWSRWSYALEEPIVNYLVTIAVGEYQVVEDTGPVPLEYIGSRHVDPESLRRSLAFAKDQLVYFNELLGMDYPYPVYRQILVQRFIYGAMENPSMTILGDFFWLADDEARWYNTDRVIAHELAHQWFGDLLTCYGWPELWLNEGFATYYASKWQEHSQGEDAGAALFHRTLGGAVNVRGPMAARSWSRRGRRDNEGVYVRGASVLYLLRHYLGEEIYDAGIQKYLRDNRGGLVESADLRRALEEVSGEHLGWLFDQWVYGRGVPTISSKHSWADGSLSVVVSQTQEEGTFSVPLTVEIGHEDGTSSRSMWLEGPSSTLTVALDTPPKWVAVDPVGAAIAKWKRKQSTEEWIAQLEGSAHYRAKIHAMLALGKVKATDDSVEALGETLLDGERHPLYRSFAAQSLGKLATSRATAILLDALDDPDQHIREAAANGLGEGLGPNEAITALSRTATIDKSPSVRNAALYALGELKPEVASTLARSGLKRPDKASIAGYHHQAMLEVLGKHGKQGDLTLLARFIERSQPRRVRTNAANALAKLTESLDDPPKKSPGEKALIAMLNDPNIRARSTAVAILSRVGTEPAEAALRAFASRNTVTEPDLQDLALDAAARIRIRLNSSDEPTPSADLKRLEEKITALEERLERMEEWR